ncbi:alkyl hydroperoxide reductase [Variovorax paradoxus]|uniref:thioredoxin-dependent peroxiredoxin n=1 Tax=Variovorax paradoxus TaxID=34073 RepID=A0A0D0LAM2_VARPD|nr:peroxiredoxin-like family protein [Variovorax paradoxus]KIQ26128.1 alkyl hydroperoxide reductase [Variovorax paradoxus]
MTSSAPLFESNDIADAVFAATGVPARAKRVGDLAPDVTLPDAYGRPVRLSDAWHRGPLVLVFYRGGWCGYCNLQLRAWQRQADDLARLGATLLAISPQTPGNSMDTAADNQLAFTVLSDSGLDAANGFDLAFTLPPDLVDFYGTVGTDIPVLNGNGLWVLPVPATYVIDEEGRIRFAHIEEDIRRRAEPLEVLGVIAQMVRDRGVAAVADQGREAGGRL